MDPYQDNDYDLCPRYQRWVQLFAEVFLIVVIAAAFAGLMYLAGGDW